MSTRHLREEIEKNIVAFRAALEGPDRLGRDAGAPRLEQWKICVRQEALFLAGEVSGHPLLGDDWISTSALIHLSDDLAWARTRSRWYKIDAPTVPEQSGPGSGGSPANVFVCDRGVIALGAPQVRIMLANRPRMLAAKAARFGLDDLLPPLHGIMRVWPPKY